MKYISFILISIFIIAVTASNALAQITRASADSNIFIAYPDGPRFDSTQNRWTDKYYFSTGDTGTVIFTSTEPIVTADVSNGHILEIKRSADSLQTTVTFANYFSKPSNEPTYINLLLSSNVTLAANEENFTEALSGFYAFSNILNNISGVRIDYSQRPLFFDEPFPSIGITARLKDLGGDTNVKAQMVMYVPNNLLAYINNGKVLTFDKVRIERRVTRSGVVEQLALNDAEIPGSDGGPAFAGLVINQTHENLPADALVDIRILAAQAVGISVPKNTFKPNAKVPVVVNIPNCEELALTKIKVFAKGSSQEEFKRLKVLPLELCLGSFSQRFKEKTILRISADKKTYKATVKVKQR